uniref:Large ribosomal subunit protein mL62 n=1 Tax=Bubo bubo TaxID=30461 RepID=A0A8C0E740_BUBBB
STTLHGMEYSTHKFGSIALAVLPPTKTRTVLQPGSSPFPAAHCKTSWECVSRSARCCSSLPARLTVSYCRSSGPGGQHVNKVNTKAEVRFHLASADWIPEAVRQKMASMHRNKINRDGELIVNSEESRYQMRNLAICLEKIRTMVTEATETPKVVSKETTQKLIERVENMNRERLRQKKIHSNIKQSRKADFD